MTEEIEGEDIKPMATTTKPSVQKKVEDVKANHWKIATLCFIKPDGNPFDFKKLTPYILNTDFTSRVMDLKTDRQYLYACTVDKGLFKIENHNIKNGDVTN